MYRNLLVPTDGSQVAAAAFKHVKEVLEPGGTVTLISVIDDIAPVLARTTPAGFELGASAAFDLRVAERLVEAQREAATGYLASAQQALEAEGVRDVQTCLLSGLPGEAIVKHARDAGCDAVVMATHGRSALTATTLGSVADYVVRHLDGIPVLLLRPAQHEAQ
jgi:nucleotide-binding universal stress UspA family protein